MYRSISLLCVLLLLLAQGPATFAQSEFRKALQEKYGFKTVSCYTCHSRKDEVPAAQQQAFRENKKAFRNVFGRQLDKFLQGKDITKRLAAVKALDRNDPKKIEVNDAVTKDFLNALKQVEKVELPSGVTYGELLKKGELPGIKAK